LQADAREGVSDLMDFAADRIRPGALPRGGQLTMDDVVQQADSQLSPQANIKQVEEFTGQLADIIKAPKPYLTKEVLRETEQATGKDLDEIVDKLGLVQHEDFFTGLTSIKTRAMQELGATEGQKFAAMADELMQRLASGPIKGPTVRGMTDSNSTIGAWMKSENGNERRFGKAIYDVMMDGLMANATARNRPALADDLRTSLQRYKNIQVLYNASNDNPSGIINPRALKTAVDRWYGDKSQLDPQNLMPAMGRLGQFLPEVTESGAVQTSHSNFTAQPFRAVLGKAAPERGPGGTTSANVLLSQGAPFWYGASAAAAAGGNAFLGGPMAYTAALGATGLGAMGFDALKRSGWKKMMQSPEFRDWVSGYGRKFGRDVPIPARLNALMAGEHVVPPALITTSGADRRERRAR
jgi:hypothetical protein